MIDNSDPMVVCLIRALNDSRSDMRRLATRRLLAMGEQAVPSLLRAQAHPEPSVRERSDGVGSDAAAKIWQPP